VLLDKINELTGISTDIMDLMQAVPQLVNVSRYGDVRQTDLTVLDAIVLQLLIKVNAGLPDACYGLDEETSAQMFSYIASLHHAIKVYAHQPSEADWLAALFGVVDKQGVHAMILGCVCRLLFDAEQFSEAEADRRISRALSVTNDPATVAAWLEGFLKGSGMILMYDDRLWNLLYQWVSALEKTTFIELLPMLRRSFAQFEYGERRKIGERAKQGLATGQAKAATPDTDFNHEAAAAILPVIARILKPQHP